MKKTPKSAGVVILLIGAGRMGGALIKGWLAGKSFSSIHVIEPSPSQEIAALSRARKIRLMSALDRNAKYSAVVLATKPQILKDQGDVLAEIGKRSGLVLSIAAGVTTSFLRNRLGAVAVVRAMPNTPGAIGKGITALYGAGLSGPSRTLAEKLTSALGETLWLPDESLMDAVTAVSGSGPAYVFLLAEALAKAGIEQGLDEATATRLARATVSGAGALLAADAREAGALRKEVTSPGGTTEAALGVLMGGDGLERLMSSAVSAAAQRSKALGS